MIGLAGGRVRLAARTVMTAGLILTFFGCGGGSGEGGGPSWVPTHSEALSQAAESHRPVVIFFTAEWSEWCRRLEEEMATDGEVVRSLESFIPVRVDVEREQALPGAYGVLTFPSLVFVDHRGEEIYRVTGFRDGEQLARELAAAREAAGL